MWMGLPRDRTDSGGILSAREWNAEAKEAKMEGDVMSIGAGDVGSLEDVLGPEDTTEEQAAIVRGIKRTCRGPLAEGAAGKVAEALAAGDHAGAAAIDVANRKGCGYNVNDLIMAQALDGKLHTAECPGCGRVIEWRAPVFD